MALPRFARTTAVVLRAPQVNDHGTTRPDWANAARTTVAGCSFQPSVGADDPAHRQAVGGGAILFMPPATDVGGLDRIEVNGLTYEVVGEVETWTGASSRLDYLAANLHVWEG